MEMKGNKIALDIRLEPLKALWASNNRIKSAPGVAFSQTRSIGCVTDRSFYADPKKPMQGRFVDKHRVQMASFDELFREPFRNTVKINGELVHVKFYQKDYRFRMEEAL